MAMRFKKTTVALSAFTCAAVLSVSLSAKATPVPRPPQYVLMAFDGSKTIDGTGPNWQTTRDFAKEATEAGAPVKFTYFISGVYFLNAKNKKLYTAPHHSPGQSEIGFGKTPEEISDRIDEINAAYKEGHEIGSHANGHYDGSRYTESDWSGEFRQFNELVADAFKNNDLDKSWAFAEKEMIGFRAPLLGVSKGMWPALDKHGIKYDTSKIAEPNYWPEKNIYGTWNFPLARLSIVGSGKWTLSMDYNFYDADSHAKEDRENSSKYEKQMLDTYMKYFKGNYYGNRAPVSIGHHFMAFNGNAYWRAMKRFSKTVCGLPEVKCVTYTELMNYMESLPKATRLVYQKGQFEKMEGASIKVAKDIAAEQNSSRMELTEDGTMAFVPRPSDGSALQGDLPGAHEGHSELQNYDDSESLQSIQESTS
ncbi:MAG: hypothetical protein H7222_16235 [Methylotenera sp.]|nr:hypothetical protein [Oligoflexia bacterium]